MKKRVLLSTIITLLIFLVCIEVKAEINVVDNNTYMVERLANLSSPKITSVTASNDLVTVKSTGNVVGYYYGNSPKLNDAKYTSTTSNTFYASVKNGVYYFWVSGSGINGGNVSPVMYANGVKVSTSCTNQSVNNCDGSGVIERCYVYTGGNSVSPDKTGVLVTPKDGYKVTSLVASSNNCSNLSLVVGGQRLAQRYCKVTFTFKCEPKKTEPAKTDCTTNPNAPECKPACTGCACDNSCATTPYLTNISVSPGILSPAFSTKTTGYTVKVDGTVDKITINATGSKGNASGTISGTGTKQLSYGSQTFKVSISNNAGTTTYNVEVIRENNKSKDNSLKSLSINNGNLNPAFSPTQYKYNVEVENDVTSMEIKATLNDSKASFVEDFGPRTVTLNEGHNQIQLKIKSESGLVSVYNIIVNRKAIDKCALEADSKSLLKEIVFTNDNPDAKMPVIEDFKPEEYDMVYNVEIPYETRNLQIEAATVTEGDTYKVIGLDEKFEPGVPVNVSIEVTSKECPSVVKTYNLAITKLEPYTANGNAELKFLIVKKHNELQFTPEKSDYEIKLKKKETKIDLDYAPVETTTVCSDDNSDGEKARSLVLNSVVEINCTAEDGIHTMKYTIKVVSVQKSTNVFLMVILILFIILLIIFLVMRLLGYKIVFNMEVIENFFRGIGDSIRNVFDK